MSLTLPVSVPVLGFAAYSGTGKTTLLEALLPILTDKGLRIGVLKHAHHDFDVDKPGKDSYRLRKAGASQMLIASRNRHVLMTETPQAEAEFEYLLTRFNCEELDLILVEGCKNIAFPKIELNRETLGKPWLHTTDTNIIAVACDQIINVELPLLDINDLGTLSEFVIDYAKGKIQTNECKPSAASSCCDILSPAFLSVEQGKTAILDQVSCLTDCEEVALEESYGRVLADDIISPIHVPAYTNSAMDGYAIRGDDVDRSQYQLVAEVLAGQSYDQELLAGQTVKIMTGAPTPKGADTVVMREQSTQDGDIVTFSSSGIKSGQNVRQAGEDLAKGQPVFDSGTRIESPEMGMIASLGYNRLNVTRKIKVAMFSTGDEVQAPGEDLQPNRIYDSNRFTIKGVLTQLGCEVIDLGILEDDHQVMADALQKASHLANVVITSGGVSVGDADYIKTVLEELGEINFWRINMRPGRPLAFGKINDKPFFGLPGNPVAVMVSLINFVEPALRKMQGEQNWMPAKVQAVASENLRSRMGRTEFSRGVYSFNAQGRVEVKTTGKQGSGILRSMSEANCLIEITPEVDTVKQGELVTIIPLQGRV
ncbi:bifunctional molybdopterin-guanine dinucleotide biosynthesis adaptor protein MobB/molybdopterin molybdotransferase MoeA [Vibrio tapetis subsp. quintayensis]|uniref:bifunctional molybdopterin-guanine dinucleotide biosynthesis adaptor protein MobB/molybdopterin molybdotransferase MoeA n=1 Tax=Vibrio tapetis TaxID=52443 RepID=UPI0025B5F945|nr:bifunctional molybdopterin-guanine dinucleotide biosynthesis adaptor protein MobB/molybdopterin molybdotransferase MoeA [Vibrio tapetis]MDN3679143.1 bifunctional molybdopterin-guanine dinucleotide biosynthesis adaptor protein MobB/molybdopterin molybdotransferase MoeA [Vibrio tapetis subsp. quintayensis]